MDRRNFLKVGTLSAVGVASAVALPVSQAKVRETLGEQSTNPDLDLVQYFPPKTRTTDILDFRGIRPSALVGNVEGHRFDQDIVVWESEIGFGDAYAPLQRINSDKDSVFCERIAVSDCYLNEPEHQEEHGKYSHKWVAGHDVKTIRKLVDMTNATPSFSKVISTETQHWERKVEKTADNLWRVRITKYNYDNDIRKVGSPYWVDDNGYLVIGQQSVASTMYVDIGDREPTESELRDLASKLQGATWNS